MIVDVVIEAIIFSIIVAIGFIGFSIFESDIAKGYEDTVPLRQPLMSFTSIKKCLPEIVNFTNTTQITEIKKCVYEKGFKERINVTAPWGEYFTANSKDFKEGFLWFSLIEVKDSFSYPVARDDEVYRGVVIIEKSK